MDGIWGGGREGHAAVDYMDRTYASPPLIVADENQSLAWPDLPGNAQLYLGPDALAHLLDADRVVVSPGIPGVHPFRRTLSDHSIPLTSGTDLWMQTHADRAIGVTGTKGKSTTTSLITALLARSGVQARLAGNIGIPLLTLPPFAGTTVVELSSYQCHSLTRSPRIAVIVDLFQEHLTWHGSLEAYWRDKCRIFTEGAEILIADEDTLAKIDSLGLPREKVLTLLPSAGVAALVDAALGQIDPAERSLLFSSRPGLHNLTLAVCAVDALLASAIPGGTAVSPPPTALTEDMVADVIAHFESLPHRLALIAHAAGRDWYDDTLSTSAESLVAAAQTLEATPRILIVGGQSRGIAYDAVNDYLLTQTGNLPYVITIPSNGPEIVVPYGEAHPDQVIQARSLDEAVAIAARIGPAGSSVILSPGAPSYDLYANYEAKSAAFASLIAQLDSTDQQ